MLLETRPGRPDHVYLTDFGVGKAALGSSGLTGTGQSSAPSTTRPRSRFRAGRRRPHGPVRARLFRLRTSVRPAAVLRPAAAGRHVRAGVGAAARAPLTAPAAAGRGRRGVRRVLAKAPEDRYPSCQEFASALREAGRAALLAGGQPGRGQPTAVSADPDPGDATVDPAAARLARRLGANGSGGTRPGATDPSAADEPAPPPAATGWPAVPAGAGRRGCPVVLVGGTAAWLRALAPPPR